MGSHFSWIGLNMPQMFPFTAQLPPITTSLTHTVATIPCDQTDDTDSETLSDAQINFAIGVILDELNS